MFDNVKLHILYLPLHAFTEVREIGYHVHIACIKEDFTLLSGSVNHIDSLRRNEEHLNIP